MEAYGTRMMRSQSLCRISGLDDHIALQDERAQQFTVPQVLLPLLHLSSRAMSQLQHCIVLYLSLWLRHSSQEQNQTMLTHQLGWQLPICSILNGTGMVEPRRCPMP